MPLTDLPRPFIVAVATDRSADATLQTIRRAAEDGAQAVELNLPAIADVTDEELQQLVAAAPVAVYTSCRRSAFMVVYGFTVDDLPDWPDEERMERQLAALHLGSCALDMEMDTFDPHPAPPLGTPEAEAFAATGGEAAELSTAPTAIARQREIIEDAHRAGAEVILSCHTGRPQSIAQLRTIGEAAVARGADLLKIVTPCRCSSDLLAVLEATVAMKASLPIPFILVGAGNAGLLSRSIGVHFGSSWVIAQVERMAEGFPDQPLVSDMVALQRLLPWRLEG